MLLLEVRCGTTPVAWSGETVDAYVGIDRRLKKGSNAAKRASAILEANPKIRHIKLIGTDFLFAGFNDANKPMERPHEVLMRDVMGSENMFTSRVLLLQKALRDVDRLGQVVVIEKFFAHQAGLEKLAGLVVDQAAEVDVYSPSHPQFEEIWDVRMQGNPSPSSRILVAEP
jgi:hypothetical protein